MSAPLRTSAPSRERRSAPPEHDDEQELIEGPGPTIAVSGLATGGPPSGASTGEAAAAAEPLSEGAPDQLAPLRRRAVQSDTTIRRFIDDAEYRDLGVPTALSKLRERFPQHAKSLSLTKVSGYLSSPNPMSLSDIEADLGKSGTKTPSGPTPSLAVTESTTPPVQVEKIIGSPLAQSPVSQNPMSSSALAIAEPTPDIEPIAQPSKAQATKLEPVPMVADGNYAEIEAWVNRLYLGSASPSREDFVAAMKLQGYQEDDLNQPKFVYALQTAVRKNVAEALFLKKTEVKDVPLQDESTLKSAIYGATWTLRHYTPSGTAIIHGDQADQPPTFTNIRSTASLGMNPPPPDPTKKEEKEKKSGHTTDTDWSKYGNVGNTFFVLCIDGVLASDQAFLKNCKWYAEFDFAAIPSLWLSSDWLDESKIKGEAMRGSGEQVKRRLISAVGKMLPPQMFLKSLFGVYNNLEVKVPGGLTVSSWKGPVKYPF